MEQCENISIASVNSVCTEPAYSTDDCNVSEPQHIYKRLVYPLFLVCRDLSVFIHSREYLITVYCTQEEEVAGSPMLCLQPDDRRWALTGVGSWRIACSKAGVERPRLYDKISSNIAWIKSTIK